MAANILDKFTEATNGTRPDNAALTAQKSIGAASITVDSTAGWGTATAVHFVIYQIDAGGARVANTQTEWKGIVSSSTSITSLTLKAGTDQVYPVGSKVIATPTAAAWDDLVEGVLEFANQDGSLITQAVRDALGLTSGETSGWETLGYAPNTITALGNRSYTVVVNSVDLTATTSVGMRLKLPRTVTAPTQCTDLEAGSSQYWTKATPTGMAQTDDITVMAWVKVESYAAGPIVVKRTGTNGYDVRMATDGTVRIHGLIDGSNYKLYSTYQSLPLNKWVHVAATMDMSGNAATFYFDGVLVPNSTTTLGTANSLTNATTLYIGRDSSGGEYFDGKIAQVAVFSSVLAAATVRSYMSQTLAGNETNCVGCWTFNGNGNDSNSNANNLTANGGVLATNADTPFTNSVTGTSVTAGTTNYGIIMAQTFSTNTTYTIQIPEGETLPTTGGIGTVSYSTQKTPYGFPGETGKWVVETVRLASETVSVGATNTWFGSNFKLNVPVGKWKRGYVAQVNQSSNVSGVRRYYINLSDVSPTNAVYNQLLSVYYEETGTTDAHLHANIFDPNYSVTTATDNVFYSAIVTSTGTETIIISARAVSRIYAENAYL